MNLSVYSAAVPDIVVEELVPLLSELGYDGVEWRVHDDCPAAIPLDEIEARAPGLKALCAQHGLEIVALTPLVAFYKMEAFRKVLRAAQSIGVPLVRAYPVGHYDGSEDYQTVYDRTVAQLETAVAEAQKHSVKLLVELHPRELSCNPAIVRQLLSPFSPVHIGVTFDPGNMLNEGHLNAKLSIEILGDYLAHVHVKNGLRMFRRPGDAQVVFGPLSWGELDWEKIIGHLCAAGYAGYLSLEDFSDRPSILKLREGLAYLQSILRTRGVCGS